MTEQLTIYLGGDVPQTKIKEIYPSMHEGVAGTTDNFHLITVDDLPEFTDLLLKAVSPLAIFVWLEQTDQGPQPRIYQVRTPERPVPKLSDIGQTLATNILSFIAKS